MKHVTIYTSSNCSYCIQAKQILSEMNVAPAEIKIDADPKKLPELMQEMMRLTQRRSLPQIIIGDTPIGGCDDLRNLRMSGELAELLKD